jgi:hypothetical protein
MRTSVSLVTRSANRINSRCTWGNITVRPSSRPIIEAEVSTKKTYCGKFLASANATPTSRVHKPNKFHTNFLIPIDSFTQYKLRGSHVCGQAMR